MDAKQKTKKNLTQRPARIASRSVAGGSLRENFFLGLAEEQLVSAVRMWFRLEQPPGLGYKFLEVISSNTELSRRLDPAPRNQGSGLLFGAVCAGIARQGNCLGYL